MLIFTIVSGTICIPWLPATQDVARLLPEEWVKIYWSLFHRRSIPVNDGFIEFDDVSCSILLIKLFKRKGKNVMPPLQSDHDGLHSERTPCKDRGWFRKWRGKTHTKVGIRESLTHRLRTYTYTYIYTYIYIYIICIYIYTYIRHIVGEPWPTTCFMRLRGKVPKENLPKLVHDIGSWGFASSRNQDWKLRKPFELLLLIIMFPHETVTYGDPPFSTRKLPRLGRRRSILGREGTLKFPDVGLCQTFSTILPKTIGGSEEFSKSWNDSLHKSNIVDCTFSHSS